MPEPTFKNFDVSVVDMLRFYYGRTTLQPDAVNGAINLTMFEAVAFLLEELSFNFDTTLLRAISEGTAASLGLTRTTERPANLQLQFSRATPAPAAILIPAGTRVQTASKTVFKTLADATMLLGGTNVPVNAEAEQSGTTGNVGVNAVTTFVDIISGIESVANTSAGTGGRDAETDAELISRVADYIATLARGTKPALEAAALAVVAAANERATTVFVTDRYLDASIAVGTAVLYVYRPGGASVTLLNAIRAALEGTQRPVGVTLTVSAVAIIVSNVTLTLRGANPLAVTNAENAIRGYFSALQIGEDIDVNRLERFVMNSDPTIYTATIAVSASSVAQYQRGELGTLTTTFTSGGAV